MLRQRGQLRTNNVAGIYMRQKNEMASAAKALSQTAGSRQRPLQDLKLDDGPVNVVNEGGGLRTRAAESSLLKYKAKVGVSSIVKLQNYQVKATYEAVYNKRARERQDIAAR